MEVYVLIGLGVVAILLFILLIASRDNGRMRCLPDQVRFATNAVAGSVMANQLRRQHHPLHPARWTGEHGASGGTKSRAMDSQIHQSANSILCSPSIGQPGTAPPK